MHDPNSLFRFKEHDVYLPLITLEEFDDHKKGMSEVVRNARQIPRNLDALVGRIESEGIELASHFSNSAIKLPMVAFFSKQSFKE